MRVNQARNDQFAASVQDGRCPSAVQVLPYSDDLASLNQNIGHVGLVNISAMIIDLPSANNDSLRWTHSNHRGWPNLEGSS